MRYLTPLIRIVLLGLFLPILMGADRRPNVVIFLTDDQGWGDLSISGNTNLSTPNIDSLARDGARFDRFFVCPVCSPTRAEFLTGRYHTRGGVRDVTSGGERLNLGEKTIAEHFRAAGYATAMFGKWHNGSQYPYHPNARGFQEYYGFTSGHWGDYFSPPLEHNGQPTQGKGFLADDLTSHAMEYVNAYKDKPFFCMITFNTPHSPMQVPDPYWARFKDKPLPLRAKTGDPEDLAFTRAALAMCENIDDNVGRMLAHLKSLNLADDTIVFYFSDNGPNAFRWNGGMKGRKGTTDEGGVRSPAIIRWPKAIKGGTTILPIAGAIDLLPTFAALCDVQLSGGKPLDGVNLAPWLKGERSDTPERVLFNAWANQVSARTQTHRLSASGKLYDMIADPGQTRDIAEANPALTKTLVEAVANHRRDVGPRGLADTRPFTVGYREFPRTPLPARDGVPHGGIERSARAPNCSYFTNWKTISGSMTWNIEVATSGRYDVEILRTVRQADVGATVELAFNGAKLAGKTSEAWDPPARGDENDRVPRAGESLVKDFKPLRLGSIDLAQGQGTLTLKALDVPGTGVMDVRGIVLTLVK